MLRTTRIFIMPLLVALSLALSACATIHKSDSQVRFMREDVHDMVSGTRYKLNQSYPAIKLEIDRSAGYAVFSNTDLKFMNFMSIGSSRGKGIVVENATMLNTYMKMTELSPGREFGVQKFKCLFIFETKAALDTFVNSGWEFKGSTTTATTAGTKAIGGKVAPGVMMYQLNEVGSIVEISIVGAKFSKDDELN